jgi:hypothetical protein
MSTVRVTAAPGLVALLVGVLGLATGCSSVGPDSSNADSAARHFYRVLAGRQPGAACSLLAPRTVQELEQSAHASCPAALAHAGLPHAAAVRTTDVYGADARVVLEGDTLFLARFGSQWKVTAAGCDPRPGLPYDCDVKGR